MENGYTMLYELVWRVAYAARQMGIEVGEAELWYDGETLDMGKGRSVYSIHGDLYVANKRPLDFSISF